MKYSKKDKDCDRKAMSAAGSGNKIYSVELIKWLVDVSTSQSGRIN
jgi:hypothetical protein